MTAIGHLLLTTSTSPQSRELNKMPAKTKLNQLEKRIIAVAIGFALCFAFPMQADAMHIMEGYLPIQYCIAWGVICLPFLVMGAIRLRRLTQDNRRALILLAMAGAFIFVISSLKVPTWTGSSSHMTGTGLSAILFGPSITSILGIIVLVFQAILLAHGGLTTLGANTFSMAIAGPIIAWLLYKAGLKLRVNKHICIFIAATLGDFLTYCITAFQLALGHPDFSGGVLTSFWKFLAVFAPTQLPLGIVEGILTVLIVMGMQRFAARELKSIAFIQEAKKTVIRKKQALIVAGLSVLAVLIILVPLFTMRGAEFTGSDDAGSQTVNAVSGSEYTPWFTPVLETLIGGELPSEMETLFFCIQTGIGVGILAFAFGYLAGRRKRSGGSGGEAGAGAGAGAGGTPGGPNPSEHTGSSRPDNSLRGNGLNKNGSDPRRTDGCHPDQAKRMRLRKGGGRVGIVIPILTAIFCFLLLYGKLALVILVPICLVLAVLIAFASRHQHSQSLSIDVMAQMSNLNRVNPTLKFWGLLALMILCVASQTVFTGFFLLVVMAILAVGVGGLALHHYIRVLALPISFLLIAGIALLFTISSEPVGVLNFNLFGLWFSISTAAQAHTVLIIARALGAISCLMLISITTPMPEIIGVLRRVRCPELIIDLMYLIYRYIFILLSQHREMMDAAKSRLGFKGLRSRLRSTGLVYSNLLSRSYRYAGQNYDAMESRCYDTGIAFLERRNLISTSHLVVSGVLLTVALSLLILSILPSGILPL
jgi:cobalt/nickel transport system permease protein